jgi:hypothetical protein
MNKFLYFTDEITLDINKIVKELEDHNLVTIQYSEPIYNKNILGEINSLCMEFNENLCVRFFGHNNSSFDCKTFNYIPAVKWLEINCIDNVINFIELKKLNHIRKLLFGINNFKEIDFLSWDNLKTLKSLNIEMTKNIDLNYLSEYKNLKELIIGNLPEKVILDFINNIYTLKKLSLLLGSRTNIETIKNTSLEELEIIRVKGFNNLDNIGNYINLKKVTIEYQLQLKEINFTNKMQKLKEIKICNCKSLNKIVGLNNLSCLKELLLYKTGLDFDNFIKTELPKSLKNFWFYTEKVKLDKEIEKKIKELGYNSV